MKIRLEDLNKALNKVQKLSQDVKAVPGIMLEIYPDNVAVAYFDNKKAVYETIDAETSVEEQQLQRVILPYGSFMEIIARDQPTAALKVENIEFKFNSENNICTIVAEKYTTVEVDENEFKNETSSIYESDIRYFLVDENLDKKYTIVSRFDYKKMIFEAESYDTWDKGELVNLLSKLSKGDENKACYILNSINAGFVVNQRSVYYIKCDSIGDFSFTVNCKIARYLVDVIGKMESDVVNLTTTDYRYCTICTADKKCGIWFEMMPSHPADSKTLAKYQKDNSDPCNPEKDKEYDDVKLLIKKDVYIDIIKNLKSTDKNDSSNIRIINVDNETGTCTLEMGDKKKGNVFTAYAKCKIKGSVEGIEIALTYATWESILNLCDGDYVEVDAHRFKKDENDTEINNYFLKFLDIKGENEDGTLEIGAELFSSANKK